MLSLAIIVFFAILVVLKVIDKDDDYSAWRFVIGILVIAGLLTELFMIIDVVTTPKIIAYDQKACQAEIAEASATLEAKIRYHEKQESKSYGDVDPDTFLQEHHELADDKDIYDSIEKIQEAKERLKKLDRTLHVTLPIERFAVFFGK